MTQTALTTEDAAKILRPTRVPRKRRRINAVAWYLVLPALALYLFIVIVPSIRGVVYAFTSWDGLSPNPTWIGFQNFVTVFQDPLARDAVIHTIIIAVAVTIFQTLLGLILALAVNQRIWGRNFWRLLFFAPIIITPIVTSYLWKFILGPTGALNELLGAVGLGALKQQWLADPQWALIWVIISLVWQFSGVSMAIYLAGLQSIPDELLEAASLDGASAWQRFRSVTLPMLQPATLVVVVLNLTGGFKVFDQVWILTQGGPGTATETLSVAMYQTAFLYGKFGYGTALAVVLTVLVVIVSGFQYKFLARRDV